MELETPELETLSSLAQHLVYRLPECDGTTIRLTLREVYRDFCRRSCCLRVRRRFCGCAPRAIPPMFGGVVYKTTGTRRLSGGFVEVEWIEIPPLSSEEAPRWLIDKYGDALCSGVLARLMAQANKPWSDPQMAVIESQRYEAAINEECMNLYAESPSGALGTVFDTSDMI
jgi:hypothetical protein